MNYRKLGKTGFEISEISLGTWQVGGKWGDDFNHTTADEILNTAVDSGINFIDTADVYGNGESEKAVGRFVKNRSERIYVATKCGRQLNPHTSEAYKPAVLRKFVENSLKNMGLETLDLIQLHCPPTEVYYRPEIFELFDRLKDEGKILNLGISVEKVEEALKGIEYQNVTSVQIIFNVGVIVRVPLASGLLTGKFSSNSTFTEGDHRNFNRNGEQFDKGETFSGIDYETGLKAVEELKTIFPKDNNLANKALRWILQHDAVSTIIPGASKPEQVTANLQSLNCPDLSEEQLLKINAVYDKYIKKSVHQLW
jgi:aryl-alcohol dehydrogenase-like predicted oxidoreductase